MKKVLKFVGKEKWRAYLFWYLIAYLFLAWNIITKDNNLSLEKFFPFKMFMIYISYMFAPVNYKMVHEICSSEWILKRSIIISAVFIFVVVVIALLEKDYHMGLYWLIW